MKLGSVSTQTSQHAVHAQLGRVARLEPLFTGGRSRVCFHSSPHTSPRPDGGRISECHELWPGSPAYFPVAPPEACALRLALSCTAVAESDFHGDVVALRLLVGHGQWQVSADVESRRVWSEGSFVQDRRPVPGSRPQPSLGADDIIF